MLKATDNPLAGREFRCDRPGLSHGRRAAAAGVIAAGLLLAGCAAFDALRYRGQPGPHAIALHRIADTGALPGRLTRVVTDAAGSQSLCVQALPILSNREIERAVIEETEDPARPTLRLFLDREGSILWQQTCHTARGDKVAVLLDGFLWHLLTVPRPVDTQSILLEGRVGRGEAEAIVRSIPAQYRRLHR